MGTSGNVRAWLCTGCMYVHCVVVLGDLWWLVVVDGGWLWLMVVGWVAGYGGSRTLVDV